MKTYMEINIRVFPVKIKDERTGIKMEDTIVLEKARLQAAQLVGIDSKELIRRVYNQQGYKVLDIGKPIKQELTIDLKRLYNQNMDLSARGQGS